MILKEATESPVTWATSVPILVFLGLSVLDLGPMYATDRETSDVRQTDVRQHHRLMPPPIRGGSVISGKTCTLDSVCLLYAVTYFQLATLWLAVHYECECCCIIVLLFEMILFVYVRRATVKFTYFRWYYKTDRQTVTAM